MKSATEAALAPRADVAVSARYKWWVVFMLWFICFFNYADRQAIFSVFPKFREEFGFDTVQLGWIGSAFMWVYAFGAPLAGFVADSFKRKNLILGGCIFWSCVTMMTGWCSRLWQFIVVRALEGLGETFYFPASMSLLSDYHSPATRSRAMSFHQSSVYVGTIAGGWLAGWFAEKHGWRMGFYFFGAAGMVLALVLYKFLREPCRSRGAGLQPAAPSPRSDAGGLEKVPEGDRLEEFLLAIGAVFRCPTALVLMAVFLGANSVATIFLTWTPTFLVEKFHFRLASAGLSGTLFIHLASALSVPLGGMLADRWSRRWVGGRMLVQALGLLAGSVFVYGVGVSRETSSLLLAMSLFGFCKGLYDSNIFASLYDFVEPRVRATAAGIMNTVGWGGGALAPLLFGWFAKHGDHKTEVENMSQAIAFGGVVYLAGAALLFAAIFLQNRKGQKI